MAQKEVLITLFALCTLPKSFAMDRKPEGAIKRSTSGFLNPFTESDDGSDAYLDLDVIEIDGAPPPNQQQTIAQRRGSAISHVSTSSTGESSRSSLSNRPDTPIDTPPSIHRAADLRSHRPPPRASSDKIIGAQITTTHRLRSFSDNSLITTPPKLPQLSVTQREPSGSPEQRRRMDTVTRVERLRALSNDTSSQLPKNDNPPPTE